MNIILHDQTTGKRFLIKGHGLDWEIFKESKGKKVDGKIKGEGEWTSCRNYPSTLPYAVDKVINWMLADPDDTEEHDVEIDIKERSKAIKSMQKIIDKRINKIHATLLEENEGYTR